MTRTYTPKAGEAQREWLVIDATDVVLGRLASHAAALTGYDLAGAGEVAWNDQA